MYAAYFGLNQPPFSIAPDPRYLFMSERHREALAHLLYGIESGGGFVLLTGEIGAGKTTVCRRFLDQIPEHARVAYIFNPQLSVGDLLQTICHEFGVAVQHQGPGPTTIKEHLDPLNAHLLQSHAQGWHSVLIIDEAQSLAAEVLEQLRLLTNLETHERKLLQIILIGQPELRQMLARPELEQLAQRVIARFHLGALSETETAQYVAHRMGVAGWQGPLPFSARALKRVHRWTGGVPRRINLLCDRALLGAYANSRKDIGRQFIDQAGLEVFDRGAMPATPRLGWGWMGLAMGTLAGGLIVWGGMSVWPPQTPALPAVATQPSNPHPAVQPDLSLLPPGPPPSAFWLEQENQGFNALGRLWGQPLTADKPCLQAQEHGLQCYRTARMTLNGLRQLDRPALLKLQANGQGTGYVLVTAITDDAIEMRAGARAWRTPLSKLNSVWHGDFATLWRTPPGQQGRLNNGYQGSAALWMGQQLSALQQQGRLPASAKTLKEQVEAFQRAHGVEVNGRASPTTLILLNRATGVDEPRLARQSP